MIEELRQEIIEAIDRGTWKHSWHLKTTQSGCVDFYSVSNLEKIIDILQYERDFGIEISARANKLLPLVHARLADAKEIE